MTWLPKVEEVFGYNDVIKTPLHFADEVLIEGDIYKHTNKVNNHKYIGIAEGKKEVAMQSRWKEHVYHAFCENMKNFTFQNAIVKYGENAFEHELVEHVKNVSKKEFGLYEMFWVGFYNTFEGEGYNLTYGGEGRKGYKCSKEEKVNHSRKMGGTPIAMYSYYTGLLIGAFHTVAEIEQKYGIPNALIYENLKGNTNKKHAYGYIFFRITDEQFENKTYVPVIEDQTVLCNDPLYIAYDLQGKFIDISNSKNLPNLGAYFEIFENMEQNNIKRTLKRRINKQPNAKYPFYLHTISGEDFRKGNFAINLTI